ncbi:spore germination protein [Bacillus massiliglaciei]|uniref:spore germination protein n=1 Tax=Bacillus massiliglaciei TaxID=1816693 RepID=UPI000DA5F9C9|nr:spore germination protein [Bacillus massiliglaciei]
MLRKKKFGRRKKEETENLSPREETVTNLFQEFAASHDFIDYQNILNGVPYNVSFIGTLIDAQELHQIVLSAIQKVPEVSLQSFKEVIPVENMVITDSPEVIKERILRGDMALRLASKPDEVLLISVPAQKGRQVNIPELEFGTISPQEAFVEDIDTNLNLIRRRLPTPNLRVKETVVGSRSKSRVAILYIEDIADTTNVETVTQRINDLDYDEVLDTTNLIQMIYDDSNTIFPLFLYTERPDRVAGALNEGKIIIAVDRSPLVILAPTTLLEYFATMEDYNMSWIPGSFFRLLRVFAVVFSIYGTPLYVAILTFHYELIPKDLLETIISSRILIPFPPLIEALFLEIAIELLREAAARLPTKVGQTLGIVGGIVIGQASVEAGLTSNILLIIVAASALASFVTPIYKMGNAIRLLRFPFLLGAQVWGGLGIMIVTMFTLTHLVRLTSLGRPYLEPIYPFRFQDWKDGIVKLPFNFFQKRPSNMKPKKANRFHATEKKDNKGKNDFYE